MAKRLAGFKYRDVTRRIGVFGFVLKRQAKGSHELWWRPADGRTNFVPNHPGDMKVGTLAAILDECGIGVDDFLAAK